MTIRITLLCDCDNGSLTCGAEQVTRIEWDSPIEDWATARAETNAAGWTSENGQDYCPQCSRRRHQRTSAASEIDAP